MGTPPIDQSNPNPDLTTTLNVSTLRTVPGSVENSDLLARLTQEERTIISELEPESAMLIALSGPGKGARFLLSGQALTIGRDPSSEIFLDDITVSRKHCVIINDANGNFEVCDLNSLNGTYVNALSTAKTSLRHGDELQVGKYRLTFLQSNNLAGKGK